MGERAAIYTRLSWAPDGSVEKVERQEDDCREMARRLGWTVSERHVYKQDNNASAWKKNRKRPGWDAMLRAVEAGEIDSIIVYHGDRLIRQPFDLELLLHIAEDRGIKLASVSGVRDLSSTDDQFVLRIEAAQACKESANTSRRVKRGWEKRAKKGLPVGGGKRSFGFEPDGVAIRKAEADIRREAAYRLLAGQTDGGVVRWLNEVSTTSQGNKWTPRNLRHQMLAPRIAGLIEQGGQLYKAAWEPIIDVEDWEELKSLYRARAEQFPYQGRERKYLLSGVAECWNCGDGLSTKPTGGKNRKDSRIYFCRGCKKVGRNQEHLDEYVIGATLKRLNRSGLLHELTADTDPKLGREIAQLERRRDEAKAQLENLADHPDISPEMVAKSLTSFTRRIGELRAQQAATTRHRLLARAAGIDRAGWDALPLDIRSQVVGALFRVVVLPATWRGPGFDPKAVELTAKPIAQA